MPNRDPARSVAPRVLVVDDDPAIRRVLEIVLGNAGFEVEVRPDGRLKDVDLSSVDILITDMFMPEQDGVELLMRLRKQAPHIRTIAMTGDPNAMGTAMLNVARKLRADRTLAKPFTNAVIIDACNALLRLPEPSATT